MKSLNKFNPSLVIFDLDGTIIDNSELDYLSFIHIIDKYDLNMVDKNEFRLLRTKGNLSTDILEALINKTIDKEFEKEHYLSERLIFIENDENLRFIKLKKDVRTVLQYLSDREIPIAIATLSRGISRVINILRMFDIYDYFFEIQCREVNSKAKLLENEKICIKEKMYTTILSKNIHRHDLSIVIGDSTCDVVASTNLGLISFGVSGDYIVQPGLAQIVRVLQSLNELITLIN